MDPSSVLSRVSVRIHRTFSFMSPRDARYRPILGVWPTITTPKHWSPAHIPRESEFTVISKIVLHSTLPATTDDICFITILRVEAEVTYKFGGLSHMFKPTRPVAPDPLCQLVSACEPSI